jgi:hypothetical protein
MAVDPKEDNSNWFIELYNQAMAEDPEDKNDWGGSGLGGLDGVMQQAQDMVETGANATYNGLFELGTLGAVAINYGGERINDLGNWVRENGLPGGQSMSMGEESEERNHNNLIDRMRELREAPFSPEYSARRDQIEKDNPGSAFLGQMVGPGLASKLLMKTPGLARASRTDILKLAKKLDIDLSLDFVLNGGLTKAERLLTKSKVAAPVVIAVGIDEAANAASQKQEEK